MSFFFFWLRSRSQELFFTWYDFHAEAIIIIMYYAVKFDQVTFSK